MGSLEPSPPLPDARLEGLQLSHPTPTECLKIWELTSLAWRDALTLPLYLEESNFLTSVPLAKDGGMTLWVLVDNKLPLDQRTILCSCETFLKRAFISTQGVVTEKIVHGVASVFCDPIYRGRGYAARMMKELAKLLPTWQTETMECIGSVLYSDIGKNYYTNLGWHPFPNNSHIELPPLKAAKPLGVMELLAGDLEQLCAQDEIMARKALAYPSDQQARMMLIPDLDHMLWHHMKEEWVCDKIFGKKPQIKGAIAGPPGKRVWVIWTHRFYGDPELATSGNTLYILRLVIENRTTLDTILARNEDDPREEAEFEMQAEHLKSVLQTAQAEAAEWRLSHVNLWDPSNAVYELLGKIGFLYSRVDRETEGVASLLWYGEGSGREDSLEWVANEKYAWC
ncbi:MAG: hypothetical protein MMC33_008222 [Icmadophila ericetorum]|nr:hypothetical protein [Icmadophila ericetorum]